ncbi:mitochondrial ribosomal protein L16 [Lactarius psammicola]|nr:mitochondrial ribosomal protein L16 [Lactarius psammicola]
MLSLPSVHSLLGTARTAPSSALRTRISASTNGGPSFVRFRHQLAPRKVTFIKRHKGVIPIPIGGSVKGSTLAYGDWGLRIKGDGVIKRKIKPVKGAKVYLRVFPDIPVCIKGNETRMGKGKGTFEFWATRVPTGRVIFEIGGTPVREELARDALRQAGNKLPTIMEFIDRKAPPRLGSLLLNSDAEKGSDATSPPASS